MNRDLIIPFVLYLDAVCLTTKHETESADSDVSEVKHVSNNWATWTCCLTLELRFTPEGKTRTFYQLIFEVELQFLFCISGVNSHYNISFEAP